MASAKNQNRSKPTSRMGAHPPKPPVGIPIDNRTVLARKGPLRRAESPPAPFCQDGFATGGSGGMS